MKAIQAVKAVELYKAKKRIPERYSGIRYFSDYNLWVYHYIHDERVCEVCEQHGDMEEVQGSKIRLLFPFLEIIDENLIMVHEHPNCRCYLIRSDIEELGEWTQEEIESQLINNLI